MNWVKENKNNKRLKYLFLLINPIIALIASISTINTRSSFKILFILSIIFGISFTVPNIETADNNFDGIRYRRAFENYDKSINNNTELYEVDTDFFDNVLYSVLNKFTSNYHILFMTVAIIMSFFMLKSLKIFVLNDNFKISLICLILLYAFLNAQIFKINAFRWYTAYWITIYSLLNFFLYKKKKYLLFILLTPFIHSSYYFIYLFLVLFFLFSKKEKLLSIILIISYISSFFSEYIVELLLSNIDFLPPALSRKVISYTNEEYMYLVNEGGSGYIWLKRLLEKITLLYITILTYIMHINYKKNIEHSKCKSVYIFLLINVIFCNFTILIPSLGSRFIMLSLPLIAYIWLSCFNAKKYNIYIYILGGIFTMTILIPIYQFTCLQYYLIVLDSDFFINSPIVSFFKHLY